MFERAPFKPCPSCEEHSLGVLMVADDRVIRRCAKCGFKLIEVLPVLDKKVIYLDQFALSEICKIEMGTMRKTAPRRNFWESAHAKVKKVVLLQRAIFPDSDIHLDETIVFKGGTSCALLTGG